ncbi:response regulator [Granulosicoccus sp.]|nr:response regulator [Granulosicoccus sp.]MDB4223349.1 response regulator [Granulosicoccus sp.]
MINTLNVLYVEDCEISVELFRLSLSRHASAKNISLDIADSVIDASMKFDADKHIAALIDWNLPDGEGVEVAQHIRERHSNFPIIFLSAAFTDEQLQTAKKYNAAECLVKGHKKHFISSILRHLPVDYS